ncbi:MAG: XdhC/CoxI family protein [Candidatus Izemoplasmatales bacterium]|nr:XdhC/CoxI family protein [Candidatus Izemoplasmatales bacterium]
MDIFKLINEYKQKNIALIAVTAVEKEGAGPVEVGKKMIVLPDGNSIGTVGGGAIEFYAQKKSKELLEKRESLLETYVLDEGKVMPESKTLPMVCGGVVTLFYEYIGPKATIYIFGGGHVGQALVNVLKTMNFHVTVIDKRKDIIDKITNADVLANEAFVPFIEKDIIKDGDYIIVCTPSHRYDYHVINKILEKKIKPRYLGMLCSPDKIRGYLKSTYETFGKDIDLSFFYSPIGLDIGGMTPEEIAISISAEILAISYDKTGHKHMREILDGKDCYWKD